MTTAQMINKMNRAVGEINRTGEVTAETKKSLNQVAAELSQRRSQSKNSRMASGSAPASASNSRRASASGSSGGGPPQLGPTRPNGAGRGKGRKGKSKATGAPRMDMADEQGEMAAPRRSATFEANKDTIAKMHAAMDAVPVPVGTFSLLSDYNAPKTITLENGKTKTVYDVNTAVPLTHAEFWAAATTIDPDIVSEIMKLRGGNIKTDPRVSGNILRIEGKRQPFYAAMIVPEGSEMPPWMDIADALGSNGAPAIRYMGELQDAALKAGAGLSPAALQLAFNSYPAHVYEGQESDLVKETKRDYYTTRKTFRRAGPLRADGAGASSSASGATHSTAAGSHRSGRTGRYTR